MYKILLACGVGASSGFIASNMRKAAKKRGIEVEVKAVPDSELYQYINDYQILMLGSHLEYKLEEVRSKVVAQCGEKPVVVIDKKAYAILDGESVLDTALSIIGNE